MASFLEDVISGHENAMYGETGTSGLYHNSPTQTNYNVNATSDLANRISQGVGSIPMAGPYLQGATDLAMPALALGASPFYDTGQAIAKAKDKYGSSYGMVDDTEIPGGPTMGQFGTELNNQNILSSMFERSLGAATPLASKLSFNAPNFNLMGSAQASELTDVERDFPGMSTGDIIDSMNNRGPVATNIATAPQPKGMSYEQMVDLGLAGPDQDVGMTAEDLQNRPNFFGNIKNKIGSGFNNLIDNPVTKGLGTAINFARGSVPGMIMSGVGSLFNRDPKSPSYQQYSPQSYLKDNNLKNIYNANPSMINDFYDDNPDSDTFNTTRFDRAVPGSFGSFRTLSGYLNRDKVAAKAAREQHNRAKQAAKAQEISLAAAKAQQAAIGRENASYSNQGGGANQAGSGYSSGSGYNQGNYCFDPSTPIQMADGSTKKIKNIQLGDNTKGGEVTGVFQFKATDEIHDYKGVTVAGSHYVKEDGRFIMVKDSPLSVKIDKIPVVYSLDTSGRRIFINDIEFADYNGDGVAKNFLSNAGADLTGFDKEVLRQVEQRLI